MRDFLRHPSAQEAGRVLREDWPVILRTVAFLVVVSFAMYTVKTFEDQSDKTEDLARQTQALTVINRNLVSSLQSAIVESCEENGNARAKVAREQLHEEIVAAENPDPALVAALDLPPGKLRELLDENIATLRDRLGRVKITDCQAQYHISPGSGERRRAAE